MSPPTAPLALSGRCRVPGSPIGPTGTGASAAAAVIAVTAYVAWFVWALEHRDYNAWSTLLIAPALVVLSAPLLGRARRAERDPRVATLITVAFFVKLVMAFVNYSVAFRVYGGLADAVGYDGAGLRYAAAFRSGRFALAQEGELGRRFIDALTGVIYTVTGPSRLGGYLIFSWIAFWGLYLMYRAFLTALPGVASHRYAVLLFFLPSTVFWTSAIGKEAWMTLALGLSALGAARLLTRQKGGMTLFGLGMAAAALCRPQVAMMVVVAMMASYLLRRTPRRTPLGPVVALAGFCALAAIGWLVTARFAQTFKLATVSPDTVQSVLDKARDQSGGGGSAFSTRALPRPLALAGVLFRPLPIEATNLPTLVASLEGTVMLGMVLSSRRRLGRAARELRRQPYLVFCLAYVAIFVAAFSTIGNFGTLARERAQVWPFALVLLALPAARLPRPRRAHPAPAGR